MTASLHPCDDLKPLFTVEDARLCAPEQPIPYTLVNGKGDHLRNHWEASDRAVVRRVFVVATFEDQHNPPFEESVVLLFPHFLQSPFHPLFDQLEDCFLDWRAFLDGEGVD